MYLKLGVFIMDLNETLCKKKFCLIQVFMTFYELCSHFKTLIFFQIETKLNIICTYRLLSVLETYHIVYAEWGTSLKRGWGRALVDSEWLQQCPMISAFETLGLLEFLSYCNFWRSFQLWDLDVNILRLWVYCS